MYDLGVDLGVYKYRINQVEWPISALRFPNLSNLNFINSSSFWRLPASMESDLENKARKAFIDDHFELAVDLYTQAIGFNPDRAELYAERSQANIKLDNFTGIDRLSLLLLDLLQVRKFDLAFLVF